MQRREFITLLGGAAATWPLGARAQQPTDRVRRIGVLMPGKPTDATFRSYLAAFVDALQKSGWIDGQNVRIELRWSGDEANLASFYAAELVALAPEVILSGTTDNLIALQRLTRTIPIVFTSVSDPVEQGFLASLTRPGGNITGFAAYEFSIGGKWLDLLKQMVPGLRRVAVMFKPETSSQDQFFLRSIEAAAPSFGVEVMAAPVQEPADIQIAIENFSRAPNGGLLFPSDAFTRLRRDLIVDLAIRYRLPAIYFGEDFVRSGGLMSYAHVALDPFRGAASYVDRILKGAKPGDLPVQQPDKYRLSINLKTAKALGLTVPLVLLTLADEVIE
jgi:putative tryptophan/tyrosine transport system substrate-binding protein